MRHNRSYEQKGARGGAVIISRANCFETTPPLSRERKVKFENFGTFPFLRKGNTGPCKGLLKTDID